MCTDHAAFRRDANSISSALTIPMVSLGVILCAGKGKPFSSTLSRDTANRSFGGVFWFWLFGGALGFFGVFF